MSISKRLFIVMLSVFVVSVVILEVVTYKFTTFNFEGVSQVLDHAVASPALAKEAAVEVVHFNSDCSDEKRTSDHDPVLVRLRPR